MKPVFLTTLLAVGCLALAACGGAERETERANNMSAGAYTGASDTAGFNQSTLRGTLWDAGNATGAAATNGGIDAHENIVAADNPAIMPGEQFMSIVTENGVRYRADENGTRVKVDAQGVDIAVDAPDPDVPGASREPN
jgi:hypothetical protein